MIKTTARGVHIPDGQYGLHIGGEEIAGDGHFDMIDPSVGTAWASVAEATPAHVDRAVRVAQQALSGWRRLPSAKRQEYLWQLADAIEADTERWGRILATENGRPIREAINGDVPTAVSTLRYYSGILRALHGDHIPVQDRDSLVYTIREPLGVIAALISWNSPLITAVNKVAPALAAGNTVVLKPSEFASASVVEFVRLAASILPAGVVNVVTGYGHTVGSALVAHPDVAKVTFTGGGDTARKIIATAAQSLTPTIMELGGKSSFIVWDDADLDTAVLDAISGIYTGNGEACIAASRLLVHETIHDEFAERFTHVARSIRIGDAVDLDTQFGPLANEPHRNRVRDAITRVSGEGVEVITGGGAPALENTPLSDGYFIAPTLLADPDGRTSASREEFFGPVTVLERFRTEDEAVERANSTRYGLAAGVWTNDLARAHRMARELEAGVVWVNKWFDLAVGAPFGGFKDSGFGREVGEETLHEYSAPKTVNISLNPERTSRWGGQ